MKRVVVFLTNGKVQAFDYATSFIDTGQIIMFTYLENNKRPRDVVFVLSSIAGYAVDGMGTML